MGNFLPLAQFQRNQFKENSIICITGASSGIGRGLALKYSERKIKLFLVGRSEEKLNEVKIICENNGSQVYIYPIDINVQTNCQKMIEKCIEIYQQLDLLVLCAGINAHFKFEELKDFDVFEKLMQTNFYAQIYCTKYALPYLKQSQGQIIVISSFSGEVGLPLRSAYCASKFAVTSFFEAIRKEVENLGIAITIICPSSVNTPMRLNNIMKYSDLPEKYNLTVEQCVDTIVFTGDRKIRKVLFPLDVYLAAYLQPFIPGYFDKLMIRKSKL